MRWGADVGTIADESIAARTGDAMGQPLGWHAYLYPSHATALEASCMCARSTRNITWIATAMPCLGGGRAGSYITWVMIESFYTLLSILDYTSITYSSYIQHPRRQWKPPDICRRLGCPGPRHNTDTLSAISTEYISPYVGVKPCHARLPYEPHLVNAL